MRWDGKALRFYEVWYFIVQRPATKEGFWIRYTLLNPNDAHPAAGAGLWFGYARRGDPGAGFTITRTFPASALRAKPGAFDLAIGDATLTEGALRGSLDAHGHRVAWDLTYEPSGQVDYYFGSLLRRLMERKTSVTVPNPRAHFRGRITIDGREIAFEGDPGHQAHHWGREKATGWRWAHCAAFAGEPEAVFEALSADKPPLPTMTFLRLRARGAEHDLTSLRAALRNRAEVALGSWRFFGEAGASRLEVEITCDPREVLSFTYHSPRYEVSTCYNSPAADARARLYRRRSGIWELEHELRAEGSANAEVVVPVQRDDLYGPARRSSG
jgi:hypothetical protein